MLLEKKNEHIILFFYVLLDSFDMMILKLNFKK
jgi:hypothetical protein